MTPLRVLGVTALAAATLVLGACKAPTPTPAASSQQASVPAATAVQGAAAAPSRAAPNADATSAVAKTPGEAFVPGGPRFVSAAAVVQALDAGSPEIVFIDARAPADYEAGHIPGAINVPYYEPEKYVDQLPKDKWLVTYCECPHAEAEQTAKGLEDAGFPQVRVIDEGLQGWKDQGREVVAGTQPNG